MSPRSLTSLAAALVALTGCAHGPAVTASAPGAAPTASAASRPSSAASAPAGAASGTAPAAGAPAAATPPVVPNPLPPFALVTRDARRFGGMITAWQKDEKVWLELSPHDFNVPLFLSPKLAGGIGEGGVLGGLMGGRTGAGKAQWVEFRRIHNQVQLIARNAQYVAKAGTPEARAVAAAFSPSLLASTVVASQPHPDRKTVLVDASALFLGDMLGIGAQLQRTYRQGYSLDPRNSAITAVRAQPDLLVVQVQSHFATAALSVGQPGAPVVPSVPKTLPDARSLFVQLHYSLSRLPDKPMAPRAADARIGHFLTTVDDYSDDIARTPRLRHIHRWRLEKQDPAAALSPPVKPITYWIDRSVPERYRAPITAGILEWNKAFEPLGFKDAIVVKVQPDDATFDTLDTGVASVRWMTNASAMFGAVGPVHVDPRSGEILDADIAIESLSSRAIRTLQSQILAHPGVDDWLALMQARDALRERPGAAASAGFARPFDLHAACEHGDLAGEQLGYALDVLALRDGADPAGPEATAFVEAYLKDVTMHEVGHTLGLRHNFRASHVYSEAQLSDPEFTRTQALSGSVMDYSAVNLPGRGQPAVAPFLTTLGPYDLWAIEYAYRPLPAEQETAELARIAGRSSEPALAYGTDEDNLFGLDPESLQGDLGSDPVVFARKRIAIARDLLRRLEARPVAQADHATLRRGVGYALRDVARVSGTLLRQIGGLRTLRDGPGTGRDPLTPVPAAQQRAALDTLAREVLSPDSLGVSPGLQRRLAPDYLERADALFAGGTAVATDFLPQTQLSDLQRGVLAQLMSEGVAVRLLDGAAKASEPAQSLALAELYRRIDAEVWADLAPGRGDIPALRRALQRDHTTRLIGTLLQPAPLGRVELRTLIRQRAEDLLARLRLVRYRSGWSAETASHLQDSIQMLQEALQAKVVRPNV
ncbi:zinc-dependent metalloprotease [Sphaerotilus sp.]|uniref:zinc-dependent metalloprotease n=1 Tax=Sphaerotilus sp. TaxID=2093942 RepID=UPI002ACD6A8D|nr:zinc-dependent metalloprotease [Sphaerotilus sp.]MDZ7858367.1 zinc-dependent metalloprotease [Sphaerotilus sp.]